VEQARLTLSTAIASSYADLARLYAERDVQAQSIKVKEDQAGLTADRVTHGLDTQAELKQAQAAVPPREQLLQIDENIALTRNALAALLGKGPDRGLSIARPQVQVTAHGLPQGITTDLIAHRPDVAAALARVKADDERIKVARAGFYPAVSISALAAHPAIGLENLVQGSTLLGGVGPSISLPIFHGGELKGKYRSARSTFDEAVATYDKSVATAFHDVADAAASQAMLTARLDESDKALKASEAAYEIARMRYEGGLSTYLNVLSEAVLTARRTHADLQARAFTLDVALVRALGASTSTLSSAAPANAPPRMLPMADADLNSVSQAQEDAARTQKRKSLLTGIAGAVVVAALVAGGWYVLVGSRHVTTDNAYVGADTALITPMVAGQVAEVTVQDTQMVHKGDILVRIDRVTPRSR
jgi:NodT family efflux transporter outer membrane factor (OMF) lipoprotein